MVLLAILGLTPVHSYRVLVSLFVLNLMPTLLIGALLSTCNSLQHEIIPNVTK